MIKPDHLVIYLSGRCNLVCSYCYARGVSRKTISRPALHAALRAFATVGSGKPNFTILGGEPLLCRDRLNDALTEIKKLFGCAPTHVFTNGLLLKNGEAARLIKNGVKLTISLDGRSCGGRPAYIPNLPRALRKKVSVSAVVSPANTVELLPNMLHLLSIGFERLAWSPDITAVWDNARLDRLRASARSLLAEYLRRLKSGYGIWELANGYEAVAFAARGERPGACRIIALAPDGFFYPCDKMLSGTQRQLKRFRVGADGEGREKFFRQTGVRSSQSMCSVAPWAAAHFNPRPGPTPRGQWAVRAVASGWLAAAVNAGLASPVFRRIHGV